MILLRSLPRIERDQPFHHFRLRGGCPFSTVSAARQFQRRGGRYAPVSMCLGVGRGVASVPEWV